MPTCLKVHRDADGVVRHQRRCAQNEIETRSVDGILPRLLVDDLGRLTGRGLQCPHQATPQRLALTSDSGHSSGGKEHTSTLPFDPPDRQVLMEHARGRCRIGRDRSIAIEERSSGFSFFMADQ
jgi:hypothetical protein